MTSSDAPVPKGSDLYTYGRLLVYPGPDLEMGDEHAVKGRQDTEMHHARASLSFVLYYSCYHLVQYGYLCEISFWGDPVQPMGC